MAKDKKKKKVEEPKLTKKELKAQLALEEAKLAKKKAKGKKSSSSQSTHKDGPKSGKKETAKAVAKAVKGDDWDEQEGGGGDFVKVDSGHHLCRVRSVISLGQVVFEFDGKKDTKATSAMGFVLEVYAYKIKKDKIVLKNKEPAIIYHVMKAHKDNDKSHYTKMMRTLKAKNPGALAGGAYGVSVYTSDKGYMYVDTAAKRGGKGIHAVGLLESKAVPKLTSDSHVVPNLDRMTKESMLELNAITQVKDYVLKAVNFEGSASEKVLNKIRKDKPEYATLKKKDDDKSDGKKKSKKGKKPKKLSEDGEY